MKRSAEIKSVQRALLIYVLVFVAFGLYVSAYFLVHRHTRHYFPLGDRVERFGDLIRFTAKFQYGRDSRMQDTEHLLGTLFPRNYPPFGVVLYLFLLQVCAPFAVAVLLGVFFGTLLIACTMLWKRVRRSPAYRPSAGLAIFLTGLLGWGSLQVAMRGNLEGWDWIATCIGLWLFSRKRYTGAGAAIGVAMAIKPYPVLWLLLMARHRHWKGAAAGLLSCAATTLGSLLIVNPNPLAAYRWINSGGGGKSFFFTHYIVAFRPLEEMMGEHSLLQAMKSIARVVRNHGLSFGSWDYGMHPSDPTAIRLYHACLPITAVILLLVLLAVWSKPVLNQVFAIAVTSTALPLVSGDYTLTILLIPMAFFLILLMEDIPAGRARLTLRQMLWVLLPCACAISVVPLGVLHNVFRSTSLLVLLASTSVIPLPSRLLDEIAVSTDARRELQYAGAAASGIGLTAHAQR